MTGQWRMSPVFVLRHAGMPWEWFAELGFSAELVELADAVAEGDQAAAEGFARGYAAERSGLRAALHRRAGHEDVRGAVFLSNPGMYAGMLRSYLERVDIPDNARFRRVERQVYLYIQRFCGKNETTSTFGPMGYGEIGDHDGLRVEHRSRRRKVLFARWALEELAHAVAREPALRAHIPLRRGLLTGARPVADPPSDTKPPNLGPVDTPQTRRVWEALGRGPSSIAALAELLEATVAETARQVRPLLRAGLVYRGLLFPAEVVDGLAALREAVAELPELPPRAQWLARLDAFAEDCGEFVSARVDERETLLERIEQRFTALTGVPARRGAGDIYADRLILFEEASSPFHLRIGRDLVRRIEEQAGPGLDVSAEGGAAVQRGHQRQMAAVLDQDGGRARFPDYAASAGSEGPTGSSFGGHQHALTVDVPPGAEVQLPVASRVEPAQRFALPDLCLLDPFGPRLRVVLARVHHHLLLEGWLTTFCDDPSRIDAQVRTWLEGTRNGRRLAAVATTRRNKGFYRFPGRRILITPVDHEGRTDVISGDELTVEVREGRPVLRDGEGQQLLLYSMLADLTTYPPIAALTDTPVLHVPVRQTDSGRSLGRVYAGDAVYQRACWELDLTPLRGLRDREAFLALRGIARHAGLPRYVFVRSQAERKPLLVDTWSPFAADVLCHFARHVSRCTAEEMLPGPDDLWLRDERGHYSCELRVQFLRSVPEEGSADSDGFTGAKSATRENLEVDAT